MDYSLGWVPPIFFVSKNNQIINDENNQIKL